MAWWIYSSTPGTHKNEPADALAVVVVRPPPVVAIHNGRGLPHTGEP